MKTVNSLSGGRTSSYMAVHHPADYEIFSLVCLKDHNSAGKWLKDRPKLVQYANDKLARYNSLFGDFVATAEDPIIIQTMMDLEQKLGKEIIWVRDKGFDELILDKNYLPNQRTRFCTTELKLKPVFEYCYTKIASMVDMRLGYRFDEQERKAKATTSYKYAYQCAIHNARQKHNTVEWRVCSFPMIDSDPAIHPMITNYWMNNTDVVFADDSNCQFCFWKKPQQKLRNSKKNPNLMMLGAILEEMVGATMDDSISLLNNFKISEQLDFFSGGNSCQSGMCTD